MIWLSTSTLTRLRDQLQARGARPSVLPLSTDLEEIRRQTLEQEWGPFVELMVLMMSADGDMSKEEREVLTGAIRNLSEDGVRTGEIEWLLSEASARLEGATSREAHLELLLRSQRDDRARAEVLFVLAAAIAFADGAIADQENDLVNQIAEGLGIAEARAGELLDEVEADLGR
jgi:uncharacterized tellurite resistance protein B-like protein